MMKMYGAGVYAVNVMAKNGEMLALYEDNARQASTANPTLYGLAKSV